MNKSNSTPRKGRKLLLHEVEVIYKGPPVGGLKKVCNSKDANDLFRLFVDERKVDYKEMFFVMLLNRSNYCIAVSNIGVGCTNSVTVNQKEIFQLALNTNSSSVIIMHNHPSGSLIPSDADIKMTQKVQKAGELMEIQLLDHLIITSESFYSFKDHGVI